MAKKHRFRAEGKSHEPKSTPQESSTIEPLAYWPNLRRALRSHGAALLIIYLEVHWPITQDTQNGRVLLDIRRTQVDLQLPTNAFWRYANLISTIYPSRSARSAAVLAGREFWRSDLRTVGPVKLYSIMRNGYHHGDTLELRRNVPAIEQLFQSTGVSLIRPGGYNSVQISKETGDSGHGFSANLLHFDLQIAGIMAETPAQAAAKLVQSMAGVRVLQDGRSRKGIARKAHTRRPWTPERRAKVEATRARKQAEKCQKTRGYTDSGTDGTI
jgi:hypothetical protein